MSSSLSSRLAAIVSLLLFVGLAIVVVKVLYRNTTELAIGSPAVALAVGGAWWAITEASPRREVGVVSMLIGLASLLFAIIRSIREAE